MKRLALFLIVSSLLIPFSIAQEDAISWELATEETISAYGDSGSWNSTYNEPGAVIYHEGQYHLFVNGYAGFPTNTGIGYKTSDDGVNFEWASDEPLFRRDDVPGNQVAIAVTDVIILEDGTWVLYFYNFNSSAWPRVRGTIGRATANEPLGEWTIDEEPVLIEGEDDSFDERGATFASVTAVEDGFVMYYIGENARGVESIGRAVSEDGITWVKDSEPVFEMDTDLREGTSFVVNEVIFDGEGWILAYKSQRAGIGFAFSEDGIEWERYSDNPVITSADIEGINNIGYISFMMNEDGDYKLFLEGNVGNRTQVYLANITLPE